ncbi:MAG: hypothetical protein IT449_00930 [Phycisphaerales bacterium]|nr:hypothetical protein [Phycisphaerales bacterium]
MRKLTCALLLLAAPVWAQNVAPFGDPGMHAVPPQDGTVMPAGFLGSRAELNTLLGGGGTTDDFEAFSIADGGATSNANTVLDETTIYEGQGPGLVNDGASYLTTSDLQWNGNGYFSLPTRTILGNSGDNTILIRYDAFTQAMGVDVLAFSGYGDNAVVDVYDTAGAPIGSMTVSIPGDASPLFVGFHHNAGIGSVRLTHTNWSWSPILNDHTYGTACGSDECPGGATLKTRTKTKTCGCYLKAILKNVIAGNSYGFSMPDGACIQSVANSRGKAVAKQCPAASGTVTVSGCNIEAGANCP